MESRIKIAPMLSVVQSALYTKIFSHVLMLLGFAFSIFSHAFWNQGNNIIINSGFKGDLRF